MRIFVPTVAAINASQKNHQIEKPYIETILKEWSLYLANFDTPPNLRQLHFGGGTPTFFSAENIDYLLTELLLD